MKNIEEIIHVEEFRKVVLEEIETLKKEIEDDDYIIEYQLIEISPAGTHQIETVFKLFKASIPKDEDKRFSKFAYLESEYSTQLTNLMGEVLPLNFYLSFGNLESDGSYGISLIYSK